jgi:protocatechuate 3,4-dioxygenase beta subunit
MHGQPLVRVLGFAAALAILAAAAGAATPEAVVSLPCEGCDAVYVQMPAQIGSTARIAPADEPGEPLQVLGQVRDAAGKPVAGVVVYAYHTGADGHYPRDQSLRSSSAAPHGRLRGWVRSDAQGNYRFDTVRPAGYPGRSDPQHIHLHVIEPGRCTYYIDDIHFDDDPRLAGYARAPQQRGGNGLGHPRRAADGSWQITRDIVLGANVPDYAQCAQAQAAAAQYPSLQRNTRSERPCQENSTVCE